MLNKQYVHVYAFIYIFMDILYGSGICPTSVLVFVRCTKYILINYHLIIKLKQKIEYNETVVKRKLLSIGMIGIISITYITKRS